MTTTQERRLHYDPATDTEIANYRAGILDGVMVTATVNVVGSLITRIDQAMERERLIAAEAQVAALTHAAEQARTLHHAQWTRIYALLGWPAEASVSAAQVVARVEAMQEAASNLVGEVRGSLGIAEPELRAALGNTNVRCLQDRMEQLRALLAPAPPDHGGAP